MIREARSVAGLVKRKQIDEAKAILDSISNRIATLNIEEGERDRTWRNLQQQLQRALYGRMAGRGWKRWPCHWQVLMLTPWTCLLANISNRIIPGPDSINKVNEQ